MEVSVTHQCEVALLQADEECQTEVHPISKHIDRGYEWNEWEHRRKALAMVNLRQKRTHGSQTILSHFRRENATQVSSTMEAVPAALQNAHQLCTSSHTTQPARLVHQRKKRDENPLLQSAMTADDVTVVM